MRPFINMSMKSGELILPGYECYKISHRCAYCGDELWIAYGLAEKFRAACLICSSVSHASVTESHAMSSYNGTYTKKQVHELYDMAAIITRTVFY